MLSGGTGLEGTDGMELRGNEGMWQSAQMTVPFLRRAFTEMPLAPVAWALLATRPAVAGPIPLAPLLDRLHPR